VRVALGGIRAAVRPLGPRFAGCGARRGESPPAGNRPPVATPLLFPYFMAPPKAAWRSLRIIVDHLAFLAKGGVFFLPGWK
ncbi:MAG: hypothetical protein M1553_07480, partial [Firmicutes bacterium]|nr:hypothetical protein [Bacillota bacterium]